MKQIASELLRVARILLAKDGEEYAGQLGFDSGVCWLGDAGYLDSDDRPMKDWEDFLDEIGDSTVKEWEYPQRDDNAKGLGITLTNFGGDVIASVYVKKEDGKLKEARIVFGG